mmetsp:Transcript_25379/g.22515  ORF Transcript_25379/g.22515 Transcript_25379/m.22515 type:complete len:84 (+) Transcript_25379:32-283(+)
MSGYEGKKWDVKPGGYSGGVEFDRAKKANELTSDVRKVNEQFKGAEVGKASDLTGSVDMARAAKANEINDKIVNEQVRSAKGL